MANITAKDVAALRAKTGLGMMDCKKALVEADGDMDKAVPFGFIGIVKMYERFSVKSHSAQFF